ncbi:MAG: hypothetical protein Q9N68_12875 [Gammaproteobacteria bacterium]|nr:hypothetical protein [Gammaproteobacteria bacterium]
MISFICSALGNVCALYQNYRLTLSAPVAFVNLSALFSLLHGAVTVNQLSMMIGAVLLLSSHIVADVIIHSGIKQRSSSI